MKRSLALLVGVAATALVLSGCSSAGEPAATAEGSGTVQFLGPEDPKTFEPVISAFEAKHPDITIKYTQVPFDQYSNTLQQRLAAKDDTIDVFAVDQPNLAQIAAQGFLEDLSDLKDKAKAATSQQQYDINIYDKKMYALSIWNSTQMLFYNKDLLDKAGVAAPSADPAERWTWEQTADAGKAAQAAGAPSGLLLEQVEAYYQLQPLVESLGGGSGISGKDMLTVNVTTDGWKKAYPVVRRHLRIRAVAAWCGRLPDQRRVHRPEDRLLRRRPVGCRRLRGEREVQLGHRAAALLQGWQSRSRRPVRGRGASTPRRRTRPPHASSSSSPPSTRRATSPRPTRTTIIPANTEAAAQYLPKLEALGGEHSKGVADLITYEITHTAVARPVSVGYVQFESLINKAFGDIRNGADVDSRLAQAEQQIKDAWSHLK